MLYMFSLVLTGLFYYDYPSIPRVQGPDRLPQSCSYRVWIQLRQGKRGNQYYLQG